jgi:predicted RNA-binding Zn-ribbon protein involved in translation (DUF1610 family)
VAGALRRHAEAFRVHHRCDPHRGRVLQRLLACRTGALGGYLLVCPDCGHHQPVYKSCDDRHCPQCSGARAARWFEARAQRMLATPHFQVVFTLPRELRAVAHRNADLVYALMARAGASVLEDLAEQKLGARLGITAVLHTWDRTLSLHPHWHVLVTAGGLSLDGQRWVATRTDFLFPQKAIAQTYRGRVLQGLIEAFDAGLLDLGDEAPDFDRTLRLVGKRHKRWVVHVEAPRDRPVRHALKYLARYVHRVAISDHRIVAITADKVAFRARDRVVCLDGHEFVRRYLLHALPKGFRKVRHYGLYAPGAASRHLEQARTLLPERPPPSMPSDLEKDAILDACERTIEARERHVNRLVCPHCQGNLRTEPLPRPTHLARGPP